MRRLPYLLFASTLFAAAFGASAVHGFDAQDVIDGRSEAERAAVKYAITRPEWDALSR